MSNLPGISFSLYFFLSTNHFLLLERLSISDSDSNPPNPFLHPLSFAVHNSLLRDAADSVEAALSRFKKAAMASSIQYIHPSLLPPTLFLGPEDFSQSYTIWITLLVPNTVQVANIRQELALSAKNGTPAQSLDLSCASHHLRSPVWILEHWPRLRTLVAHTRDWAESMLWLDNIA